MLQHALEDSLGSRPPRGAPQNGPSTYWIDDAISGLREQLENGDSKPFASGNITYLQLRSGQVEARYDVDADDSDSVDRVPVAEFVELLSDWRQRILQESPGADLRVP